MAPIPEEYLPKPFQKIITLKDNTILNGYGALAEATDDLFIWPDPPMTIPEATVIFSDASKIDHIRVDYSEIESKEFDGYSDLISVGKNTLNKLAIRLRKPRSGGE